MADIKYKKEFCEIAVDLLKLGKSKAAICAKLDICRATLYEWVEKHTEFAAALNLGVEKSQQHWEDIGEAGIKGEIKNFMPTPWIFLMKNRFARDYVEDKAEKTISDKIVDKLIDKLSD